MSKDMDRYQISNAKKLAKAVKRLASVAEPVAKQYNRQTSQALEAAIDGLLQQINTLTNGDSNN